MGPGAKVADGAWCLGGLGGLGGPRWPWMALDGLTSLSGTSDSSGLDRPRWQKRHRHMTARGSNDNDASLSASHVRSPNPGADAATPLLVEGDAFVDRAVHGDATGARRRAGTALRAGAQHHNRRDHGQNCFHNCVPAKTGVDSSLARQAPARARLSVRASGRSGAQAKVRPARNRILVAAAIHCSR